MAQWGKRKPTAFDRRILEAREARPMVTSCAVDDCGWRLDATVAEGREAARQHRAEHHPELATAGRRARKAA